jgi:aminoglycoside phosphotransferase family enzyme/predicted kinase
MIHGTGNRMEHATPDPNPDVLAEGLARPDAYPDDPSAAAGVQVVQTHISYVFLTGRRVYKLRKQVDLDFIDFSSAAARNADCERELRLNRRLAPDVYLGMAPVRVEGDRVRIGPLADAPTAGATQGREPEHCVVMRRLPDGSDALSRLRDGRLEVEQLDAVAERVAAFHRANGLGTPAPFEPADWLERITRPVTDNFASLAEAPRSEIEPALLARAREGALRFQREHAGRFERRRREGRAVDGHGDLHLDHVWFEPDSREPLLIDCIEFSERLRRIDAASDVAFLAMDLAYRERPDWAARFLRRYARASDDFDLYSVVDYFSAYRAGVRAKVAALVAAEPEVPEAQRRGARESAGRHLELAADALHEAGSGALLLVAGIVGSGKSTLAELAADALEGVVIASDRVRKQLAGLAAEERGGAELYSDERIAAVYAALLERAGSVVESGRVAILDATWARCAQRQEAQRWAQARGAALAVLEARCGRDQTLERLARRAREGTDPSDAGPELYELSAAAFEPIRQARLAVIHTDAPGWREAAPARIRELLPSPGSS